MTSLSEQTKKVVKLNTEDHEPEDIDRGILYMDETLVVLGEIVLPGILFVILLSVKIIMGTFFFFFLCIPI